jgi:hypothetical protein
LGGGQAGGGGEGVPGQAQGAGEVAAGPGLEDGQADVGVGGLPSVMIPLTTSCRVPSPPRTAMVRQPAARAPATWAVADPGAVVATLSTVKPPSARVRATWGASLAARPLAAVGL